jgi:hypothetical protein
VIEHDEKLVAVIDVDEMWCADCGYAWSIHPADEIADGMALRHPTEAEAREAWGR